MIYIHELCSKAYMVINNALVVIRKWRIEDVIWSPPSSFRILSDFAAALLLYPFAAHLSELPSPDTALQWPSQPLSIPLHRP